MFYLLYHLKDADGLINPNRLVHSFKEEKEVIQYVERNKNDIEIDRVIESEKEYFISWRANLIGMKITINYGEEKKEPEKKSRYIRKGSLFKTPEEVLKRADKAIEQAKGAFEGKCSKCGGKIVSWNKSGICGDCQQGKKPKKS